MCILTTFLLFILNSFESFLMRNINYTRDTPKWLMKKLDDKTFSFVKKHVH